MEDKTFELVEKLYSEFASFRKETRDRFDGIDERFDGVDERFDGVDERFDGVDERFDGVDERFDGVDEKFDGVDEKFDGVDERFKGLETEVKEIKKTVIHIEQDHGKKLQALFDGYKQHSDQLERIEEKVSIHEDIIVRKVK